jgi:predicted Zn-dependent peptidase
MESSVEVIRTKNNCEIVLDRCSHINAVAYSIMVKAGTINETNRNNGVSHFLEHLLFRARGQKITDVFSRIGSRINAFTSKEYTCFFGKSLTEYFVEGMESLIEYIFYPKFNEADLEIERKVILEELIMYSDNFQEQVKLDAIKKALVDNPLALDILGTEHTIKRLLLSDLYKYHDKYYKPSNVVISISGFFSDSDINHLVKIIENINDNNPVRQIDNNRNQIYGSGKNYIENKGSSQSRIFMCYPTISRQNSKEDIYCLALFNQLFGISRSSILNETLREKKGLVYTIYSYPSLYHNVGLFNIFTTTSLENENTVLNKLFKIIDDVTSMQISEDMLGKAKKHLLSEYVFQLESLEDRMIFFGKKQLLNEHYYDKFSEEIEGISTYKVNSFLKKIFDKDPVISIASDNTIKSI